MELKELIDCVNMWKTSEAANLVFQWIFVLDSVKHKLFPVSIVNLCGRRQRVKINNKYSSWEEILFRIPQSFILGSYFSMFLYMTFFYLQKQSSGGVKACNFMKKRPQHRCFPKQLRVIASEYGETEQRLFNKHFLTFKHFLTSNCNESIYFWTELNIGTICKSMEL